MTRPLSSNDINGSSNTRSNNGEELSSVENQQEDVQTKNPSLVKQIQTSVIIGCSLISYLPFILQMYKTDSALIYVFNPQDSSCKGYESHFEVLSTYWN